jgi:hypothetical protein
MLAKLTRETAVYLTDGAGGELLVRRHLSVRVAGIRTAPGLLHAGVHIHGGGGGKGGRLLGATALHPAKGGLLGRRRDAVLFLQVVIQGADEKTRKIRRSISKFVRRMELVPRTGSGCFFGPPGSGSVSQRYGYRSF